MKLWTIAAAAFLALPTAALACSCVNTDDPVELRTYAADSAELAVAVVEVETLSAFDPKTGAGERMRVVRSLAGPVSGEFAVQRGPFPSSASCDQLYEKGQRAVVLLYESQQAASGQVYKISGLCTVHLLEKPVFRDEIIRLIGSRSTPERG